MNKKDNCLRKKLFNHFFASHFGNYLSYVAWLRKKGLNGLNIVEVKQELGLETKLSLNDLLSEENDKEAQQLFRDTELWHWKHQPKKELPKPNTHIKQKVRRKVFVQRKRLPTMIRFDDSLTTQNQKRVKQIYNLCEEKLEELRLQRLRLKRVRM